MDRRRANTMSSVESTSPPTNYNFLFDCIINSSTSDKSDTNNVFHTDEVDDEAVDNFLLRGRPRSRSLYSSPRPLVYITRRVPQHGLDVLLPHCNISQWDSEESVPRGELLQSVQGVHGILCMPSDVIDAEVLDQAGSTLRAVATLSATTDHIDKEECARRNIKVLSCPPPDLSAQADLTVALILLTLRNAAEGLHIDNLTHDTTCDLFSLTQGKPVDVTSAWWSNLIQFKTFGVYGFTSLGISVAKRLRQLGANDVIIADHCADSAGTATSTEEENNRVREGRRGEWQVVTLDQFLARSDVICVCDAHATAQSEAVFDEDAFQKMKTGAIVVNSDGGHALNYMALYQALRDGRICAAGLNTCNQMSVPFKYPLQGLRNCVFMPQTQESGYDLRHKLSVMMATNLLKVLKETE
ncbi:LOW QUALITY PROTEIN: glyoxylate reductase/hydroxypyruvate reductase-like [Pomacea canaliculata]|uniref:LOW QUALITY PROTEIN: glyoxylate reductase/hydroxypyruvate reductase-like n=1 Tax=Pomacea canaliculata TaxID=400727 RepID=UPI000D72B79F|nr:LOW QUALITY PROTEIN: glyoxylate reductase/hydroxypyruvate reductase-like [Pomacea canaliculata]